MRNFARAASFLVAALVGIALGCARTGASHAPAPARDTDEICRGSSVPSGWLMMNSRFDRERCFQWAEQGDNVVTIWRYDDKPVGTEQQVCERAPTPAGWVATSHRWDPSHCRIGQGIEVANLKTIKRVS